MVTGGTAGSGGLQEFDGGASAELPQNMSAEMEAVLFFKPTLKLRNKKKKFCKLEVREVGGWRRNHAVRRRNRWCGRVEEEVLVRESVERGWKWAKLEEAR